jgi:16S rRNA (guanine527-N7)-methyltransferase
MPLSSGQVGEAARRWGLLGVAEPYLEQLAEYGNLLVRWNARISLTAIRGESEILERHILEGVLAAAFQPETGSALDFGSGTGIPGIPIAICRPGAHVVLAESLRRKAAFLAEAIRTLGLGARVHAGRAEDLPAGGFDAVWMRAVDQSERMAPLAAALVSPGGLLGRYGTHTTVPAPPPGWVQERVAFPDGSGRLLLLDRRTQGPEPI